MSVSSTLTIWDYITLASALIFVVVYTIVKIKELINPASNGCGNCTASGSCSAPLTKQRLENQSEAQKVSLSSINKKHCPKMKV